MRRALLKGMVTLVTAVSCTETIDFSSEFEKKITVNLILENKDIQELSLCYNAEPGSFRYESITEADVRLYDGENEVGKFIHNVRYRWKLNYIPVAGHTYRLSVKVPGHDEITAETTMPVNVQMKRVHEKQINTDYHKLFSQKGPASPYWIFVMLRSSTKPILTNDVVVIESEDNISHSIGSDHVAMDNFNADDFLMFTDLNQEAGESFSHDGYLRIGETDKKLEYPITFFIESWLQNAIVVFRAASDEYDKYLKSSIIKANAYMAEDDPTAYFEENVVYSNIKGGLGIFAACSDTLIARSFIIDD